jgi:dolichyl-phosphate beta-glucosyltransferase
VTSSKLLLVIPAHNEQDIIASSVRSVSESLRGLSAETHIVVVVNGSTDNTAQEVTALALPNVEAVSVSDKGKGIAIIHAARSSYEADFFGFIDADLSADPASIVKLLEPLQNGKADIAIGSRLADERMVRRSFWRTFSSRCFNLLRLLLVGVPIQDSQCGLKMMNARSREVFKKCEERGWFFDLEFLARAHKQGLSIQEIPIAWEEERFKGRKSKLRLVRDAFGALAAMVRIRVRLASIRS